MTFQPAITVKKALDSIHRHEFVLPAIQREFVWDQDQICRLFDSLMRGYPVGSFLFWKVGREKVGEYSFYDFVRTYHQRDAAHCPKLDVPGDSGVTAVLDGQQRLTALNIGLRGTHAVREPRKWWNNPNAFIDKRLYLKLNKLAAENEAGMVYDFQFLSDERAREGGDDCWFLVPDILTMKTGPDMHKFLVGKGLGTDSDAFERLDRLHRAIHSDAVIHYYLEEHQELDHVLDIFIRVNSGGTVLSFSDLLLSIATAEWADTDARAMIHKLVDELNQTGRGFGFSKDFVLKAGLMLADVASVGFRVTNFNKANMQVLKECWPKIDKALRLTAQFANACGFSRDNLTADSPLLLVAYYLYQRGATETYLSASAERDDRAAIRSWLVRSLLKPGVWGSGLDATLTALRSVIKADGSAAWPTEQIESEMARRGRGLRFEDEELEDLLDVEYRDRRTFALLSLLYPYVDFRNVFHVDHVYPQSRFRKPVLMKAGVSADAVDDYKDKVDRLANLQLLDGPLNQAKSDLMPAEWVASQFPKASASEAYLERHDLGQLPTEMTRFPDFFAARRRLMRDRLKALLGVTPR
ncbi:MAG: DUF262 domain-containing protein [Myxococcales bacterium]|nr:DUF262 domain-containing protein [Myxococcales bacterium]